MPAKIDEILVRHRTGCTGYTIPILHSKTDQKGKGREVEIALATRDLTRPVLVLENWMKVAAIQEGFDLRSSDHHMSIGESLHKDLIGAILQRRSSRPDSFNLDELSRLGPKEEVFAGGVWWRRLKRG